MSIIDALELDELLAKSVLVDKLRAALKECADDLEAELNGRYAKTLDYPSQKDRYDRDMVPVIEARKLLDP